MEQILTFEDFKGVADVPNNVDEDKLNSIAIIQQEKFLTYILCKETYDKFLEQWITGESYLEERFANLLPYIKKYLIFKTFERLIFQGDYINTASGFRVVETEIDRKTLANEKSALVKQAQEDSEFYKDVLANYLETNKKEFPEWAKSKCGCGRFSKGVGLIRFSNNKRKDKQIKIT